MTTAGKAAALSAAIAGLALAGCAQGSTSSPGAPAGAPPRGGAPGPGMMGGGPGTGTGTGYRFSTLTCDAPQNLPGTTVVVTLADMAMNQMMGAAPPGAHMMLRAAPTTVPAGKVSLIAQNRGWRTHELVVLPLPQGQQPGQRLPGPDGTVSEKGSLGEASTSCGAGAGDGIRAGTASWTTLTLAPGDYELICNLPNHYADGMHTELRVTSP